MNFTYFKFLFIGTVRKKPVWITWLLFLLTCSVFLIIVPLAARMNTLQLWANTTMTICQTFLGMTAALFTAVLAINIFKDGNEEGTELIVVSKPITRMKIVITKFIVFAIICLIVNLSCCLITSFTAFLPRTESKYYWGLIISMLIGNSVAFLLFGSIAILMTARYQKAGVIIVNLVLSLVFLIYQSLTLLVFRTPTRALTDSYMAAPSYIITNRNLETGEYKEEEIVKFTPAPVQKKDHPCTATNWKEMKDFWEKDILGSNPTAILNGTDLAGQVALSYLSVGVGDYSARQAQRAFSLSRYYDYKLTNPASPEIIDNDHAMPWLYVGKRKIEIPVEGADPITFFFPAEFGYAGVPPISSTRLRGYTDLIPIGYVKSKEILSQREVYLEASEWQQYKNTFNTIYNKIFDYSYYIDLFDGQDVSVIEYPTMFARSNESINRFYQLMWCTLTGKTIDSKRYPLINSFQRSKLQIKSINDLNDRFMQFKYYSFVKAQQEQQVALNRESANDEYEKAAKNTVLNSTLFNLRLFNTNTKIRTKSDKTTTWFMTSDSPTHLIQLVEPGTQTLCWDLIEQTWDAEKTAMENESLTKDQQIPHAIVSTKGVMDKTTAIFEYVSYPKEFYLFESLTEPKRSAKLTGDAHINTGAWVPYPVSLLSPFYDWREEFGLSITACQPIGHNLQYFFYTTTPVTEYWKYAIIWAIVSLGLFAAGAIVYNKFDFK